MAVHGEQEGNQAQETFGSARQAFLTTLVREIRYPRKLPKTFAEIIHIKSGADSGLAVIGDEAPHVGPYSEQIGNTYICLKGAGGAASLHLKIGGISADTRLRLTNNAVEKFRKYVQGSLV